MTLAIDNILVEKVATLHALCKSALHVTKTLNGSVSLVNTTELAVFLDGSATGFSVVLPNATTLVASDGATDGWFFEIYNPTNDTVTIKYNDGTVATMLAQQSVCYAMLGDGTTANGVWYLWQVLLSSVASGVINYNVVSSTPFVTTSLTDVLITGFQVTPQAGTYACWYNSSILYNTTPKSHWWSFYKAGVKIADSERSQDTAHSNQVMMDSTMTVASFNGSQTCDVRVRCSSSAPTPGQITVNARTMLLIRLGT